MSECIELEDVEQILLDYENLQVNDSASKLINKPSLEEQEVNEA